MIVLVGSAGSGKGTQGHFLQQSTGYEYISTGEILRQRGTAAQKELIKAGNLLPDPEIIEIVDDLLDQADDPNRLIMDGFPRTVPQAEWLMTQVESGRVDVPQVVNLEVTQEEMYQRLTQRGRQDDDEAVIRHRFDSYQTVTRPILDYFKSIGVSVFDIDAGKDQESVRRSVAEALELGDRA